MKLKFNTGSYMYGGGEGLWYKDLFVLIINSNWYVLYFRKQYPFFKFIKESW